MSATADELLRMSISGEAPASTAEAFSAAKAAGNAAFARGDHEAALTHYAAASAADPSSPVPHANASLCLLRLVRPFDAARAASEALELLAAHPARPGARALSVKALLRRSAAREDLAEHALAAHDLREILALEPGHPEATARLRALRAQGRAVDPPGAATPARPRIVEVSAAPEAAAAASTPAAPAPAALRRPVVANGHGGDAAAAAAAEPPAFPAVRLDAGEVALARPRGSAGFETAWRGLGAARAAARGRYLATTVGAAALKGGLLGESVTSGLVREAADALAAALAEDARLAPAARDVARALATVSRFDMAVMFLSEDETGAVRALFDTLEAATGESTQALRRLYTV